MPIPLKLTLLNAVASSKRLFSISSTGLPAIMAQGIHCLAVICFAYKRAQNRGIYRIKNPQNQIDLTHCQVSYNMRSLGIKAVSRLLINVLIIYAVSSRNIYINCLKSMAYIYR